MFIFKLRGTDTQDTWTLNQGSYLVGRGPDCTIRITDPLVSRRHASIEVKGEALTIKDLASLNGLFVNGQRVQDVNLHPGDHVEIGSHEFLVIDGTKKEISSSGEDTTPPKPQLTSEILERGHLATSPPLDSQRLQVLYKILEELGAKLRLEEVLPDILMTLEQLFTYDRCSIVAKKAQGGTLTLATRPLGEKVPFSRSIVQRVLDRGEALLYDNIQSEAPFTLGESILGLNIRSVICSPLIFMGQIKGLVYLDRSSAGAYSLDDLSLLRSVCQVLGIVLENSQLYEDLQKRYQQKSDDLHITQQKLISTERTAALGRLAQVIAHEIRNPVMIIGGLSKMLSKKITDVDRKKNMAAINAESQRLERMMQRVDSLISLPENHIELCSLNQTIHQALENTKPVLEERGIHVHFHSKLASRKIPHDANLTKLALIAVLQNASEIIPEKGSLHLSVVDVPEGWEINISEIESGVQPTDLKGIFDPFFTTHPWAIDLGFTLAHQAMAAQGGGILISGNSDSSTAVRLVLPQQQAWPQPGANQ